MTNNNPERITAYLLMLAIMLALVAYLSSCSPCVNGVKYKHSKGILRK